jgi:mono/diheme cytochrome c family protein
VKTALRWSTGLALLALLAGCRGDPSRQAPIHVVPNMDTQERYNAYEPSGIFADGRVMQEPPAGTVARGQERADDALWRGRTAEGEFVTAWPEALPLTADLMKRGQERYAIFCAPCHDGAGEGKGIVQQRGLVPIPSYHEQRIREMPIGQIYETIRNGVRTMPAYRHQIPVEDRWAIVAYVRALQRSQYASAQDADTAKRENQ